eukprot:TRINITY_DN10090_c0_g1_i1.p1 TRINITY_DN10090_c0_g1~~TRINITY_DN10090_c0_g1_i1.p1  ORF type:complete len:979 (+),score=265.16 TRINITY_DN10090_c0_g1_i1:78-3014(+)
MTDKSLQQLVNQKNKLVAQLQVEIEEQKNKIEALTAELVAVQRQSELQNGESSREITLLRQQVQEQAILLENLELDNADFKDNVGSLNDELRVARDKSLRYEQWLHEKNDELDVLRRQLAQAEAQTQNVAAENSVKHTELRRYQSLEAQLSPLKQETSHLTALLQQKDAEITRLEKELKERAEELQSFHTRARSTARDLFTREDSLRDSVKERDVAIAELQATRDDLSHQLIALQQEQAEAASRVREQLEELREQWQADVQHQRDLSYVEIQHLREEHQLTILSATRRETELQLSLQSKEREVEVLAQNVDKILGDQHATRKTLERMLERLRFDVTHNEMPFVRDQSLGTLSAQLAQEFEMAVSAMSEHHNDAAYKALANDQLQQSRIAELSHQLTLAQRQLAEHGIVSTHTGVTRRFSSGAATSFSSSPIPPQTPDALSPKVMLGQLKRELSISESFASPKASSFSTPVATARTPREQIFSMREQLRALEDASTSVEVRRTLGVPPVAPRASVESPTASSAALEPLLAKLDQSQLQIDDLTAELSKVKKQKAKVEELVAEQSTVVEQLRQQLMASESATSDALHHVASEEQRVQDVYKQLQMVQLERDQLAIEARQVQTSADSTNSAVSDLERERGKLFQETQKQLSEVRQDRDLIQKALSAARAELAQLKDSHKQLMQQHSALTRSSVSADDAGVAIGQLQKATEQLQEEHRKLVACEQQLRQAQAEAQKAQAEVRDGEKRLATETARRDAVEQELYQLKQRLQKTQVELESTKGQVALAKSRTDRTAPQAVATEEAASELQAELQILQEETAALQRDLDEKVQQIDFLQKASQSQLAEIAQLREALDASRGELAILRRPTLTPRSTDGKSSKDADSAVSALQEQLASAKYRAERTAHGEIAALATASALEAERNRLRGQLQVVQSTMPQVSPRSQAKTQQMELLQRLKQQSQQQELMFAQQDGALASQMAHLQTK